MSRRNRNRSKYRPGGKKPEMPSLLSEEETTDFIETAIKTSGSLTTAQIEQLVEWAENARMFALMVDMVIQGDIGIAPGSGKDDPVFVSAEHAKVPLR